MHELEALNPLDGRYNEKCKEIRHYFSERALFSYRIFIETKYLEKLCKITSKKIFSELELKFLNSLRVLDLNNALKIKELEDKVKHDIKAVEYYFKEKLQQNYPNLLEMIHFGLTSDDVNNLAYALMLRDSLSVVLLPKIEQVYNKLIELSKEYNEIPMLARTHGQPASPTTVGKEFLVFAKRLEQKLQKLKDFKIEAKLNGATGTYSALNIAYPEIDWLQFSEKFITELNLKPNLVTTQIISYDNYAELFDLFKQINTILIDLNQDMWRYISDDWFKLKVNVSETGSSTMPHKVNPIDFENSEGILGVANALFEHFSRKLPISRLQRDLSDSVVKRFIGSAFGCCLIGYNGILSGLEKIDLHYEKINFDLEVHPEVIAEAIQTILRKEKYEMPYEKLKDLTMGKKVTLDHIHRFIEKLEISDELKLKLKEIRPSNYIGLASKLR